MKPIRPMKIAGVILAGGRSTRMGVDKAKVLLADAPLWRHVAGRLATQSSGLLVVAPSPPDWLGEARADWVADAGVSSGGGPALGLLAALRWLDARHDVDAVLIAPVDAPLLPPDLCEALSKTMLAAGADCAIARRPDGLNPTFGLWCRKSLAPVEAAMLDGERALHRLAAVAGAAECGVWDAADMDPFFNINTPDDLLQAEAWLARGPGTSGGA